MLPLSIFSICLVSFREIPFKRLTLTVPVALKPFLLCWRRRFEEVKKWSYKHDETLGHRLSQVSLSLCLSQGMNFFLTMLFLGTVQHWTYSHRHYIEPSFSNQIWLVCLKINEVKFYLFYIEKYIFEKLWRFEFLEN